MLISMKIHREGVVIILITLTLIATFNFLIFWLFRNYWVQAAVSAVSVMFFMLVIWFFRDPVRAFTPDPGVVISPADGEIVIIEEVNENEYFHDKRIQVSIFMSPLNVHINRYPVEGVVKYCRYHPGKYIVAWHPKSSELNERSTVVLQDNSGHEVLVRQIAGAVARRIVTYAQEGSEVEQGGELGFIKFGSRVDIFLPAGTEIEAKIGQKVRGNIDVIARW